MHGNYYSNSGRILFRHHPERMDSYPFVPGDAGFCFGITRNEWIAIILCFGVVLAAEGFNTAIERLVNLVSPERNPIAGDVKDIAAGSVLICAIVAAIVGIIIFMPYVLAVLLCNMG